MSKFMLFLQVVILLIGVYACMMLRTIRTEMAVNAVTAVSAPSTLPLPTAPTAPSASSTTANTPTVTAAPPPAAGNPYPKGMAQNTDECGQPGYDSNNFVCHPVGRPIDDSKISTGGLSPAINALNDDLAKLGSLSVTSVNDEGYPIFNIECNAQGQCVNGVGIPMGSLQDIAKEMTAVRTEDIHKYGYKCDVVCIDGRGNIIGRPETPTVSP